ncbi:MAG: protein phosphatase 2C domain-containing protein, partial [Christensenellaceae bacterium]
DERTIITACDGHGGEIYIRSDKGSKFASEAIINVFKRVEKSVFYRANREEIEKKLRLEILCEWNALVERNLAEKPLTKRETAGLNEDKIFRLKTDPQVAYGTTLNGAMIFGNKMICASLGDGGCFVFKRGEVYPVFDDDSDENVANLTYSMCQTDAFNHLAVKIIDLPAVDGAIVFTDGLINPYRSLDNFATALVKPVVSKLLAGNSEEIDCFITEMGVKIGIGDDVSIGMLLSPEIKPKYYKGK